MLITMIPYSRDKKAEFMFSFGDEGSYTHNYRHIERGNQTESAAGYTSLFPASVRCSSTGVVFLLTRGMASASETPGKLPSCAAIPGPPPQADVRGSLQVPGLRVGKGGLQGVGVGNPSSPTAPAAPFRPASRAGGRRPTLPAAGGLALQRGGILCRRQVTRTPPDDTAGVVYGWRGSGLSSACRESLAAAVWLGICPAEEEIKIIIIKIQRRRPCPCRTAPPPFSHCDGGAPLPPAFRVPLIGVVCGFGFNHARMYRVFPFRCKPKTSNLQESF
ncbi:hypothetical protein Taro_053688 [Colocasia esculenta]|uniref:Uncharacterized protein n=1 Tax=Colocasia esculenta TaxID=4460 RepID=A0A843XNB1_COLES|nr:hypothetical protein [Colocasia esculenta]